MVNFGPLEAEIGPVVWDTPDNFNEFRVLAALLHGTPVLGVSQTLRRWTYSAGRPSPWASAHILVCVALQSKYAVKTMLQLCNMLKEYNFVQV